MWLTTTSTKTDSISGRAPPTDGAGAVFGCSTGEETAGVAGIVAGVGAGVDAVGVTEAVGAPPCIRWM